MTDQTQPARPKLFIELIHDVICSWCPIGLQNIRAAMTALDQDIDFELNFLPYELNPEMPPEGEPIEHYLIRRNGWTREQFADYAAMVVEKAEAVGLTYDYSKRTHYYNTAKAHRLIGFAEQTGQHVEIVDALTNAYFRDGIDVSKTENLIDLANETGLDTVAAAEALEAHSIPESLRLKYQRVRSLSVKSTPSLLINQQVFVQGSSSAEYFEAVFTDVAQNKAEGALRAMV